VVYYRPLDHYLRSLYNDPELVPYLWNDSGSYPPGHTTRSRGYREKMHKDPMMKLDHRNVALMAATDGVPYFKDQVRGGWPLVIWCCNLPFGLSNLLRNCHISALQGSEYFSLLGSRVVRTVRDPKRLPVLFLLADDLCRLYKHGTPVIDTSIPSGLRNHKFDCRACLMSFVGDWPGLSLACGMAHMGHNFCHWCKIKAYNPGHLYKTIVGGFRRYLGMT
jgi:hypothetical protein